MKVTAIFDIGKTNKKFFLFDENHQEVHKSYCQFAELTDEDGYPADDLTGIVCWMQNEFRKVIQNKDFEVAALNFSTYGASFVHLRHDGKPAAPLYNYTKPYPYDLLQSFYNQYGPEQDIACQTASPALGMLNSGLQLYWLQHLKPDIYRQVRWSLHLPQYLSYIFTQVPVSEYTSIGCHTTLWDYKKGGYHRWVYGQKIDKILAPIVPTHTTFETTFEGQKFKTGVGIHDSSAALLPYLKTAKDPFLLVSTGTWSISLNPFSKDMLTLDDLQHDCLNFLRADGHTVRAARLFLGQEYNVQVEKLCRYYQKEPACALQLVFDEALYQGLLRLDKNHFRFENISLARNQPAETDLSPFAGFEEAYYQLMKELMVLQVQSMRRAIGRSEIQKIYVDGGFVDNDIYLTLLAGNFPQYVIEKTSSPLGSAMGAVLVMNR